MGGLYEILYDILFQPKIAMENIREGKKVGQAFLMFLPCMILPIWTFITAFHAADMGKMMNMMLALEVLGGLVIWILGATIWNLIAELFGGRGSAASLFTALGFIHIVRLAIIPLWALVALMPEDSRTFLTVVSMLTVIAWAFYLDFVAIKEVHQLSAAKTVLVMITPLLCLGLLCIIAVIFIGSSLMHMSI